MGHPPISFQQATELPIVGAICTFNDVQPDVLITCTCEGPHADRLIRLRDWGAVGTCRACKRSMGIKTLSFDYRSQQIKIEIGPVVRRDPSDDLGRIASQKPS